MHILLPDRHHELIWQNFCFQLMLLNVCNLQCNRIPERFIDWVILRHSSAEYSILILFLGFYLTITDCTIVSTCLETQQSKWCQPTCGTVSFGSHDMFSLSSCADKQCLSGLPDAAAEAESDHNGSSDQPLQQRHVYKRDGRDWSAALRRDLTPRSQLPHSTRLISIWTIFFTRITE